jgi:hypothetical protein
MTEIEFTQNTRDKDTMEFYPAGEVKKFADKRAQEFIEAGVAKKTTGSGLTTKPGPELETKEEKKFE